MRLAMRHDSNRPQGLTLGRKVRFVRFNEMAACSRSQAPVAPLFPKRSRVVAQVVSTARWLAVDHVIWSAPTLPQLQRAF